MNAQASSENLCEKSAVSEAKIEAGEVNVQPNEPIVAHPSNGNSNNALASAEPVAAQSEHNSPNRISTDFEELPNGTLVELIQPGPAEGALAFVVWTEGNASLVEQFEQDGRILIPPAVDQRLGANLRLPVGVKPCPTAGQLFTDVCAVIRSYVDLPERSICLVAAFALSTWFVDRLAVAPYLWICGPSGSGKTTLVRLLGTVCAGAPC